MTKPFTGIAGAIVGLAVSAIASSACAQALPPTGNAVLAQLTAMTDASYADLKLNTADLTYENNAPKVERRAQAGDPLAENDLGVSYVLGDGVAKDPVTGAAWIAKAAAQNDREAMVNQGQLYRAGLGVPKDEAVAVQWFIKGGGGATALAFMECLGQGTPVDYGTAAYIFAKAGDDGNLIGAYEAGLALAIGRGAPQNFTLAYYYLSIAARYKTTLPKADLPQATMAKDLIATIMTKDQIQAGQARFDKWRRARPIP